MLTSSFSRLRNAIRRKTSRAVFDRAKRSLALSELTVADYNPEGR